MGGWIRGFSLMRSDRDKPMGILGNDCVTILDISGRVKKLGSCDFNSRFKRCKQEWHS